MRIAHELAELENVAVLKNSTAWAYWEHGLVLIREQSPNLASLIERNWNVRARQVILASGASEKCPYSVVTTNLTSCLLRLCGAIEPVCRQAGPSSGRIH